MDKKEVLEIIRKLKNILLKKGYKVEKIVLFGSFALEEKKVREDSDIDIAIISEDFNNLKYWDRVHLIVEIIKELFYPMDIYLLPLKSGKKRT